MRDAIARPGGEEGRLSQRRGIPNPRLEAVLREIERRFGRWAVYRLAEARPKLGEPAVPTSVLSLDLITGCGGVPRGRLTELAGPATCGKTTLACHVLAMAQQDRGLAAYIDADHAIAGDDLARCGVDLTDLLLAVPQSAAEALDVACLLVRSGGLDALVVGSLSGAARLPGGTAATLASGLAQLNAALAAPEAAGCPTAVVLLRHEDRPLPAPAARALRHFASLRLQATPRRLLRDAGGDVAGLRVQVTAAKTRFGPAGAATEFDVLRHTGADRAGDLLDLALRRACVVAQPLGLTFGDTVLGAGRDHARRALAADPALAAALQQRVLSAECGVRSTE